MQILTIYFFLSIFPYFNILFEKFESKKGVILFEDSVYLNYVNELKEDEIIKGDEIFHNEKKYFKYESETIKFLYFLDLKNNKLSSFFTLPEDTIVIEKDLDGFLKVKSFKYQNVIELINTLESDDLSLLFKDEGNNVSIIDNFEHSYINSIDNFEKRRTIIERFNNSVPLNYIKIFQELNIIKRLEFLLNPYNSCSVKPNFTPNVFTNKYNSEINSSFKTILKLQKNEIKTYSLWLSKIVPHYLNYFVKDFPDHLKIQKKFDYAIKNLNGEILNIALTSLMLDKSTDIIFFKKNANLYFEKCTNEYYKNKINLSSNNISLVNSDSELLNTLLEKEDGNKISWNTILKSNEGKIIYIDFWASWCAGCKINLGKIQKIEKKYNESITVIYVSKDYDKNKWKNSIGNWNFTSNSKHYLLEPNSKLAKILTEPSIPRGSIVDKNGKIVSISFESVSSSKFENEIVKLINLE